MGTYAAKTEVSSIQSRADIEKVLTRYGADSFGYLNNPGEAMVIFTYNGIRVQFRLPLPNINDFARTPTGRVATDSARQAAYEQAVRQKWRALLLVTKAKLEAVESGISTFEAEFLAHIVLPGGRTVGDQVMPMVHESLSSGIPAQLRLES